MSSRFDYYRHELRANRHRWRRCTWSLVTVTFIVLLLYTSVYGPFNKAHHDRRSSSNDDAQVSSDYYFHLRNLLQANVSATSTTARTTTATLKQAITEAPKKDPMFPPDLFTPEQRRNGAVVCHIVGMIYMFVALAIVCDEFFIPALDVITEKMAISEDVAGATFMAAGGSAPELFTSIIGVFISHDDVGIGTIVGSAVFNILFVLSMCAIFSKSVLELTWWPLFRDVSFYSLILITLVLCFKDSIIFWYEALILLLWYAGYVFFMKYNEHLERFTKNILSGGKVDNNKELVKQDSLSRSYHGGRKMSTPILHGGSKFRQGVLQLMIHSIDPLYEEPINMAMKKGAQDGEILKDHVHPPGAASCPICGEQKHGLKLNTNGVYHATKTLIADKNLANGEEGANSPNGGNLPAQESVQEELQPLDVSWPSDWRKQINYVLLAPILFPLWLTLPDVKRPTKRKWFAFSFLGSILWIAIYSYLMVWWATLAGDTIGIPVEVMGLTFLAAGTSIPDLITSVLVARKGFGDMAVSSSVGSNIFDVTVGLPLPWFLFTLFFGPVSVNSSGMICSVILLFLMLMFVIITIAVFNWRLNMSMAFVMFLLYFGFIACTLVLEYRVINCSTVMGSIGL